MNGKTWTGSLAALLLASGTAVGQDSAPITLSIGDAAPPLKVDHWISGQAVDPARGGRLVLVDFWATWCGPCKMEIPHLIELQEKYRDQGLTVIGITYDDNPDKDVPPYAAEVGMNYVNVRADDALKSKYAVIGLPTLIIYDRDGNEVMKRPGYIEKAELEAKITPLLAPASS